MRRDIIIAATLLSAAFLILPLSGCGSVDDDRIPNMAVNINMAGLGMWNTYGVSGYGQYRRFILTSSTREPSGFPYSQTNATGFGGVLLIGGIDPFTGDSAPQAYDLACPVERVFNIRVNIEGDLYEAVCPKCGSHYDVTMGGGAPLSGPAAEGKYKYALRRYSCLPAIDGGYVITN